MIGVKVSDEQLVQVVVVDLLRCNAFRRAQADVEDELVAVAELDQPAGRRLLRPGVRHACSASYDSHLVGSKRFGTGIVHVAVFYSLNR